MVKVFFTALLIFISQTSNAACADELGIDAVVLLALKKHLEEKYGEASSNPRVTECGVLGGMTSARDSSFFNLEPHRSEPPFVYYMTARCSPSYKVPVRCHSYESRKIEFNGALIEVGERGSADDYSAAINCLNGPLQEGKLIGKRWNHELRQTEKIAVPPTAKISSVHQGKKFREYWLSVGEYAFTVTTQARNLCIVTPQDQIQV